MKILRAIVAGERDPKALASLRCTRVKKTDSEIVDALTGNFLPDQVFALTQALEGYDFFHAQMKACDAQIERYVAKLATRPPIDPNAPPVQPAATAYKRPRRKNQVHFNLRDELVRISGVDLTRITGIDELTAQTVIAEVGVDVSAFRTEKHFASWLALAPNHQITGGRVRRRTTRPSASRLAASLRVAAQALHRSKSALGAFYRRMRARLGAPKAITAAAHKLAILIYRMLKHGEAFVEKGQSWYEENYKQRAISNLHRNARSLGFQLVPSSFS
jgi:transposase